MSLTVMALPLKDCSVDEAPLAIGAFIIPRYVSENQDICSYKKLHVPFKRFQCSNKWMDNEYMVSCILHPVHVCGL